ncbi:sporulation integral membrane protein YlbJ [Numidum massiliense]|uniref:sporulation integral membrane protein YlbJ n=1 Tax=Numidum massiliense TaxID=1522315 RepID=UPI0006D579A1|nr:sporulation integral membrane protein YlbJ [Numidum massiliense]
MVEGARTYRPWFKSVIFGITAFFLVVSIVLNPEVAFQSSLKGLKVWWEVVFPALLPFFIASEILMGFGVVHFLGVLLEPFMRPVFRVPGAGAFVMAMGLASGYPIGAKLTARLREQNMITRTEGERLVSFTNTADPLFMFGAVAVGFFHDVSVGVTLAIAHYTASLFTGIVLRFHEPRGEETPPAVKSHEFFLVRAVKAMHDARLKDGRSLGTLMGEAIMSSVNTILMVGGFIMMFSVVIEVLSIMNVTDFFAHTVALVLTPFGIPKELSQSVISGFFEITLGSQVASEFKNSLPLVYVVAVTSAVIAWSGLSVHAQVASILSSTDIRYTPYLMARFVHAVAAAVVTILVWNPVQKYLLASDQAVSVFLQQLPENSWTYIWARIEFIGVKILLFLLLLIALAIVIHFAQLFRQKGK